jgi:ribosomal 50S subunit-recycling heat shock protein
VTRTSHAWRDHPRSEGFEERGERGYERRPAFGGRGEYRDRRPDRDDRRRDRAEAVPEKPKKEGDRIAKLMARAGLCSRRDAEEWVRQGRVSVNGRVITSPALDVTSQDTVLVDGAPLPERERTRAIFEVNSGDIQLGLREPSTAYRAYILWFGAILEVTIELLQHVVIYEALLTKNVPVVSPAEVVLHADPIVDGI